MQVFKNKSFSRWAKDIELDDASLMEAINEMVEGLYEASLGGSVYKKRVSIGSKGKSGGARTIVAFKTKDKAFFVYGFAKNKKDNVSEKELDALKALARVYFGFDEKKIKLAIKAGELIEVKS